MTVDTSEEASRYGSRAWLEAQYARSTGDPWGLDWRASQQYRYAAMIAALERAVPSRPSGALIVDVGCATGGFTARLTPLVEAQGGSVVGVDIAEPAIARARQRFPALEFDCLDLTRCAEKFAGSADLVTCLEVLYYLPREERPTAIRALRKLLRPGSTLLVSCMIARPPYLSQEELHDLVASELRVIDEGVLHLKPLVLTEKLLMRLGVSRAGTARPIYAGSAAAGRIEWVQSLSKRMLGALARSHAYVLARLD